MQVYLIRHGNMSGDPHRDYTPPVEGCLSETGVEQAEKLGLALAGIRFDAVYASPLGRAIQTAQAFADAQGMKIGTLPWLVEWRPAHVMNGGNDANYETMLKAAALLRPEESWKTADGEGTFEMAHRIVPGWLSVLERHGIRAGHGGYLLGNDNDSQRIALVAHGGSLGLLLAFILGIPFQPFAPIQFAETGVAIIDFVKRADVWYPVLKINPLLPG
jgi:broad specificity phosphatase PhoE